MKASRTLNHSPSRMMPAVAFLLLFVTLLVAEEVNGESVKIFSSQAGYGTANCGDIFMSPANDDRSENMDYGIGLRSVSLVELPRLNAGPCQTDPGPTKQTDPTKYFRKVTFADDLICNQTQGTRTLAGGSNSMEYTRATFSSSAYPNLTLAIETAFVQQNYSERIGQSSFFANYLPSGQKISLEINHWPWVSNDSSLALFMVLYFRAPEAVTGNLSVVPREGGRRATNTIGKAVLTLDMDISFVTDGLNGYTSGSDDSYIGMYDPNVLSVPFALGFCNQYEPVQFETLNYDPTLSALFVPADPTKPQTPEAKSSSKWVIPVSIVLVLLAIAIVGVIVFVSIKQKAAAERSAIKGLSPSDRHGRLTNLENPEQAAVAGPSGATAPAPAQQQDKSGWEAGKPRDTWSTATKPPRE